MSQLIKMKLCCHISKIMFSKTGDATVHAGGKSLYPRLLPVCEWVLLRSRSKCTVYMSPFPASTKKWTQSVLQGSVLIILGNPLEAVPCSLRIRIFSIYPGKDFSYYSYFLILNCCALLLVFLHVQSSFFVHSLLQITLTKLYLVVTTPSLGF